MINQRRFPDQSTATVALADHLTSVLMESIAARGTARIAVSGGRTPASVFRLLRQRDIDWRRVIVSLTDERWLPPAHTESNEHLARSELLVDRAAAATFVPFYGGEESPQSGLPACERRLEAAGLPFDAIYLGMGDDGHIASIFPGDELALKTSSVCHAVPADGTRVARMTLSARTILAARDLALLYTGMEKTATIEQAMRPGEPSELPVRLILQNNRTPLTIFSAP